MSLIDRDRRVLWHPYGSVDSPAPLYQVAEASGATLVLVDESGRSHEVVDAMSSWWCMIHGYRHPVLDAAVREQVSRFSHVMFGGLTHAPAVELAELLVSITPAGLDHVFLADSGSVSVEVALKLAVQYQTARGRPRRQRILTVRGGYHGDTLGAMSVCDPVDGMHSAFAGLLSRNLFGPQPPPAATATEEDIRGWREKMAEIAARDSDEIAAIIIEPSLQGAGGMFMYPDECVRDLRRICDEHGLLLILDEIATGFARTGPLFAADGAGVVPDIMCVGKALTGGYLSLAAMLCTSDVALAISDHSGGGLLHGPTFMANPLGCAVALASVRLLVGGEWSATIARIHGELASGLAPARELPGVRDVRVLGAVGVVQLTESVRMAEVTRAAIEAGVWVRPFRDLVYTMPPFISSSEQIASITAGMLTATGANRP